MNAELEEAIRSIAARASTIVERARGRTHAHDDVERRWRLWVDQAAAGSEDDLAILLAHEGLSPDAARAALGDVTIAPDQPLPAWAEFLQELAHHPAPRESPFVDVDRPIPFEALLGGFVDFASRRLRDALCDDGTFHRLSPAALAALQRGLLVALSQQAGWTLQLEFAIFRESGTSLASMVDRARGGDVAYQAFVAGTRWLDLFDAYPVLARTVSTLVQNWVDANALFLRRLDADIDELHARFCGGKAVGRVESLTAGLSDPHRGGHSVLVVTFANGTRVVYKPRSLHTDLSWYGLLEWLNARAPTLDFAIIKVCDRETHGWMQFVPCQPCADVDSLRRYYRRMGTLLCLLHVLQGTDAHTENVLACGEYPVVVDVETLLQHAEFRMSEIAEAEFSPASVLRVGMLPSWDIDREHRQVYDTSALGAQGGQVVRLESDWADINTDRMGLFPRSATLDAGPSSPTLENAAAVDVADFCSELLDGFTELYRFMLTHRDAMREQIVKLRTCTSRLVFRATRVYARLMRNLSHPSMLADGAVWSIGMRALYRPAIRAGGAPPFWPLLINETAALERMDFPYFSACCDSDVLNLDDGTTVRGFLVGSSLARALDTLDRLDASDLAMQRRLLETSVALRRETQHDVIGVPSPSTPQPSAALLEEARRIGDALLADAIPSAGGLRWMAPAFRVEVERYNVEELGGGLYNGAGGIALFLAALGRAVDNAAYRTAALDALRPLTAALRADASAAARIVRACGLGGLDGLGSMVYTLACVGGLLCNEELLNDAHHLALLATDDRVAADEYLDVSLGSAGALLGILAQHRRRPHPDLLDRARACGARLLAAGVAVGGGGRAWRVPMAARPLTGLAHGAAGFAWALIALHRASGEDVWREAALEAMRFERGVFVAEDGNWPDFRDLRPPGAPKCAMSWCAGAPGIVLTRAAGLGWCDTAEIRAEIDAGLDAMSKWGMSPLDLYCCGNAGLIDVLHSCARDLRRPTLEGTAQSWLAGVMTRARQDGNFRLYDTLPPRFGNPSLFRGTAGLGYVALRLALPGQFPSVLVWE